MDNIRVEIVEYDPEDPANGFYYWDHQKHRPLSKMSRAELKAHQSELRGEVCLYWVEEQIDARLTPAQKAELERIEKLIRAGTGDEEDRLMDACVNLRNQFVPITEEMILKEVERRTILEWK